MNSKTKPSRATRAPRFSDHRRILLGLAVGALAGIVCNLTVGGDNPKVAWTIANITDPIGALFLRLLLMIVVPLVFASLVVGVAGIGDVRKIGRVGAKCFAYTMVVSAISVLIGLVLTNTIKPGKRVSSETQQALHERYAHNASTITQKAVKDAPPDKPPLLDVVETIVPVNPVTSMASSTPQMLHIMFFALVLGIALTMLPQATAAPFLGFMQALYEISALVISFIMKMAPYAVACLLFNNFAQFGLDLVSTLGAFMLTVLLGLALHMFGTYSLSLMLLSRVSPIEFFKRIKTVMLVAFSTSSSNATLPTTLKVSEENLGVPKEIGNFTLTIGATANQNGTALYEGATILFIAQLAGLDLPLSQQIMIAYLAILGGIGTAGVPAGSIPFIAVVLASIRPDLPALIAVVLGIDRILDMCRTTLNVTGDLTVATYVARSEGHDLRAYWQRNPAKI